MRILITGATGFIGGAILKRICTFYENVNILVRRSSNLDLLPSNLISKVQIFTEDDINSKDFISNDRPFDCIIHAATSYGNNPDEIFSTFFVNELLPIKLIEIVLQGNKITKFINLDTFFNNGRNEYDYLSSYTLSKCHFQQWGQSIAKNKKICFINMRLFHVYGPGDKQQKFVPFIFENCINGNSIDLTSGTQTRDFIFLNDVIDAIECVVKADLNADYHTFDVGTGELLSIEDLVKLINKICGNRSTLNFGALPNRHGEFFNYCAQISSLKKLGWEPKIQIKDGLENIYSLLKLLR
jgi:CDP-paratose synthetase